MKNINHSRIPNSLRKYRKAIGYTQKDVAEILGLKNTSLISRWESGFCLPKLLSVFKLAILYRTMPDALYTGLRRCLQEEIFKAEQKVLQNSPQHQNDS